ncbi:MAG: hypothetical protein ACXVEB_16435 [Bacteroidia bacterium]
MSSFKEKSQVFLIGILVGLINAGGFFILKLDNYFKELSLYKSITKTFSSETKTVEPTIKKEEPSPVKDKQISQNKSKDKKVSEDQVTEKTDFVMDADSLKTHGIKDSIVTAVSSEDEIVVRKDELLSTKTLEVFNLDPLASKMNSKDSLLQKVSGIKDDRSSSKQFFNIEFWSSPLNYKGYKLGKYKLIVYGIPSADGLKLFKLDDVIYLKSSGMVYRLDYSADFKPYERITDEVITNKLK